MHISLEPLSSFLTYNWNCQWAHHKRLQMQLDTGNQSSEMCATPLSDTCKLGRLLVGFSRGKKQTANHVVCRIFTICSTIT